jgi:predicted transcriptional regulator
MGQNTGSTVLSIRLPHEEAAALMRIAEGRDLTVHAMLAGMVARRVSEIRQEEGW